MQRAAVFGAPIGQDAQQRKVLFLEKGDYPIVEQVSGGQGILALIQLDLSHSSIGVKEGLLINPADALDGADLVGVLTAQIAWMLRLDLACHFALLFGFLQSLQLGLSQDHRAIVGQLFFQRLQPFFERFQVRPLPD